MKSKYIRAICLGAAGLLVISTAAINNHKQSEDVTARAAVTSSVIEESAETVDAGVTAGIASVTAQALASDEDVAAVSDTDTALTAAAQEEVTSVYGYTNLGIAVVDSGNLNVREAPGTDATLVGKMPNHAACEVLGVDGEWTQIQSLREGRAEYRLQYCDFYANGRGVRGCRAVRWLGKSKYRQ